MMDREQIKTYLETDLEIKVKERAIRAIKVNPSQHAQPPLHIVVGKVCAHLEPDAPPEQVLAIFDATTFLVCTATRGAGSGLPYFFAREDVRRVEFDDES
ncbi:MAG: hypothetical protein ABIJ61_08880 [bacterium]